MALTCGDPVPWFVANSSSSAQYCFDSTAGRYLVLCFFGSAVRPSIQALLKGLYEKRDYFDDQQASFFGVSTDPDDARLERVTPHIPGIRFFWDLDLNISQQYGVVRHRAIGRLYRPTTFVLDPNLRVLKVLPIGSEPAAHVGELTGFLSSLPRIGTRSPAALQAPVLVLPRILEPEFCRTLIDLYRETGGEDSGFMTEQDGKTVGVVDYAIKRRFDYIIEDEKIRAALRSRIQRRLLPEIKKAFQFDVTRIERYIVACYDGKTGGHFKAHRDNTTKGTAHRRFAVTINLNADEYDGGGVVFPEYGSHVYHAQTGGALVFSCSLLHEATPVTEGVRYATLPFLYDDRAAEIRQKNRRYLAEDNVKTTLG